MPRYPSPALSSIYNKTQNSEQGRRILDMGEMRPGTFSFFSSLRCKVHFENLRDLIQTYQQTTGVSFQEMLDGYLTEHPVDTQFDVVLFWDLINYLSIDDVVYLFNKVQPYCKPNTLIYSITYIGRTIPALPAKIQITDTGDIDIQYHKEKSPKRDAYTISAMLKRLPQFMMETNLFTSSSVSSGLSESVMRFVPHMNNADKSLAKTSVEYRQQGVQSFSKTLSRKNGTKLHVSPGLKSIFQQTRSRKHSKILDIGNSTSENNNALLNFAQRIFPENISALVKWGEKASLALPKQALVYGESVKFDAVLTWDLFNFLDYEDVQLIGDRLAECCSSGTLLYILAYSRSVKPAKPQRFFLQPNGDVEVLPEKDMSSDAFGLNTVKLLRAFKNTTVKHNFIMKEGMHKGFSEYVLEYQ